MFFQVGKKICGKTLDNYLFLLYNHSRNTFGAVGNGLPRWACRQVFMKILISQSSGIPIYEQIKSQIKEQILSGALPPDSVLPSIRVMAKELNIGIITAKRAYDDLCAERYAYAVQGKGVFVAHVDRAGIEELNLAEIEKRLNGVATFAKEHSVPKEKVIKVINNIWGDAK